MASFFNTPFSTFIRGAQTTIHEWQMMLQSLRQTVLAGLVIVAILSVWQVFDKTSEHDRYIMQKWIIAGIKVAFLGPESTFIFTDPAGKNYELYASKFLKSQLAATAWHKAWGATLIGLKIGLALSSVIVLIVLFFFYFSGRRQGRDFHVRGSKLGTPGELVRALRKFNPKGTISLGGIRLPARMELTNIAMIGAPQTGKSVQIRSVLKEVRTAKQRAIVYDYGGLFIQHYYREGKDVILNPMDARSAEWRPWYDAFEPAHFEQQAASLVPDDKSVEDFWPKAARTVYVALARKLERTLDTPTLNDLLFWGLQQSAEDVARYLKGTEATSAFGKDKTAASIMAHLATYLKSLNYLRTTGVPFSIREWVADSEDDSWLFISTHEAQLDTVRPLISLWFDVAISSILSLPENRKRRFWYIVDELTTMHAIPTLAKSLTHAPKYGGCGIVGFQSKPLLEQTYNRDTAAALIGGCKTQCIFSANDVETQEWAEDALGKTEIAETNEGISYGVTKLRDGRTTSVNRTVRPLILASEVRALQPLQYFLSMGSGLPIVPIQIAYRPQQQVASHYIPNPAQQLVIEQSCERFENQPVSEDSDNLVSLPVGDANTNAQKPQRPPYNSDELPLFGGEGRKPAKTYAGKGKARQSTLSKDVGKSALDFLDQKDADGAAAPDDGGQG